VKDPWDFNPDLSFDRLSIVANTIREAIEAVLERREPEMGDDGYAIGTRAFSWQKTAIEKLVVSEKHPWLGIVSGNNEFVFRIGAVPVRFFSGDHDKPHKRTARQTFAEFLQPSLDLAGTGYKSTDLIWRFVVEKIDPFEVSAIYFAGYDLDTCSAVSVWEAPDASDAISVVADGPLAGEDGPGILPKPSFSVDGDQIGKPSVDFNDSEDDEEQDGDR